jgi:hypothetical protein
MDGNTINNKVVVSLYKKKNSNDLNIDKFMDLVKSEIDTE